MIRDVQPSYCEGLELPGENRLPPDIQEQEGLEPLITHLNFDFEWTATAVRMWLISTFRGASIF